MSSKRSSRHEVISLRLSEARVELLERCRRAFADELGRDVSLSEAAFLALEDRATEMERTAARAELLRTAYGVARRHLAAVGGPARVVSAAVGCVGRVRADWRG
jgi:hypothetical protein